jgi:DNA-directed RNA polymerase subunit RPC12/RpoP
LFCLQFEKLIESLDSFSLKLQLDIIQKVKQKLIDYEKTISFDENNCKSTKTLINDKNLKSKSISINSSNDSESDEMVIDFETKSHLKVRKSKRLLNKIKLNISYEQKNKLNDKQIEGKSLTLNDNKCSLNENINETKLDSNDNQLKDKTETKTFENKNESLIKTNKSEDNEKPIKRKWRRAKDVNELKCRYCGKIWRSLSHLEIHMRSHTGEKKYSCDECGQRFAQLSGLRMASNNTTYKPLI